jgi:hypothetical protein
VSSIDSEGIQNGWIKKVLITTAMIRAVTRSPGSSAQKERFFFFSFWFGAASRVASGRASAGSWGIAPSL